MNEKTVFQCFSSIDKEGFFVSDCVSKLKLKIIIAIKIKMNTAIK
jgi:hypothetical protein